MANPWDVGDRAYCPLSDELGSVVGLCGDEDGVFFQHDSGEVEAVDVERLVTLASTKDTDSECRVILGEIQKTRSDLERALSDLRSL